MKFLLPLLVAIAVCSAGVIEDPNAGYKEGDRYIYFPGDGDGIMHLVDLEEPVDYDFLNRAAKSNGNQYWLFTRRNPTLRQVLVHGSPDSITHSYFDPSKTTVFLAHGWNGNGQNTMNVMLTNAFLQTGDVNVIVVDWNKIANRNYATARNGVEEVGRSLGRFAIWLTSFGMSYDNVHLVGFSLGGHLVGNAGKEAHGRFRRITALDPAGPLYKMHYPDRVIPTDAQYVEIIHTNSAMYGFRDLCGDADFYPNGGDNMPVCWINSCSHSMAYEYMASTVKYNHLIGNACASIRDAEKGRCSGESAPMGNADIHKFRTGIFRVDTAKHYPF